MNMRKMESDLRHHTKGNIYGLCIVWFYFTLADDTGARYSKEKNVNQTAVGTIVWRKKTVYVENWKQGVCQGGSVYTIHSVGVLIKELLSFA